MKTLTAAQAKNAFGQLHDMAQREPVLVTRNDRPVGVFLSLSVLEDIIWGDSPSPLRGRVRDGGRWAGMTCD